MAPDINIDVGEIMRGMQDRMSFLLSADKTVAEVIDILRDTHRILAKFEQSVDRLEDRAREAEDKLADLEIYAKRFDRLEEAVLNIERATLSVEAALHALPKAVQSRITRELRNRS